MSNGSDNSTEQTPSTTPAALPRITRRQSMQWVMAAVAASALPGKKAFAAGEPVDKRVAQQERAGHVPDPSTHKGYGVDPELIKPHKPGDFWPLMFDDAQRKTATALADTIIPQDDLGPAASEVGVVEMIDEWISSPYPEQKDDRPAVLNGLAWIDAESKKRFGKTFAALDEQQAHAICDDICDAGSAKPEFRTAAQCFNRFRHICAAAYYATPAGWKAIGYIGNIPLGSFDGPPPEVLQRLGVEQTVS